MRESLVEQRRELHMHPELSFEEWETGKKIREQLLTLGYELQEGIPAPNCVAILRGGKPGKTVALRADIDALPITEENDVPYRSQNEGVMHACGHDAHTAMLLGAAKLLADHRDCLDGNVKLIFQQAEELIPGGAKPLTEAGVMENPHVDAIFTQHVQAFVPVGSFSVSIGPAMAATDTFKIHIRGKGGHGGHYHAATDIIVVAAQVISALQIISSRKLSPFRPIALSICNVHGGTTDNVLPDEVVLGGTLRTYDTKTRTHVLDEMHSILGHITAMHGASYTLDLHCGYPAVINDADAVAFGKRIAEKLIGEGHFNDHEDPSMGGEDFAYYLAYAPGAMFNIGIGNAARGITASIHNSRFDIDEDCLPLGTAFLASLAYGYLKENA